jgi:hypothetical protein
MPDWARNALCWVLGLPLIMAGLYLMAYALLVLALAFRGW